MIVHSDWLSIASYLTVITSHKVIITEALNFKMTALHFVINVTKEVINMIEENSVVKSSKDLTEFGGTLSKIKK